MYRFDTVSDPKMMMSGFKLFKDVFVGEYAKVGYLEQPNNQFPDRPYKNIETLDKIDIMPSQPTTQPQEGTNLFNSPPIQPIGKITSITPEERNTVDRIKALGKPVTEVEFIYTLMYPSEGMKYQPSSETRAKQLYQIFQQEITTQ